MSIRDDHEDVDRIQLTTRNDGRGGDFKNVGQPGTTGFRNACGEEDLCENQLVVSSSTLETRGDSPNCLYHLMSPTVPARTPVDPRYSLSDKPLRVRMILPELNRGTN